MNISKEDILRINHGFGGNMISDSSLDYAIEMQKNNKLGIYKKLAYLIRAILVDHPFLDPEKSKIKNNDFSVYQELLSSSHGNKRTATFICLAFAEENKKQIDNDLIIHQIISIASKNIIDIKNIEWRLKNAIR